jgi:hypothetical protein
MIFVFVELFTLYHINDIMSIMNERERKFELTDLDGYDATRRIADQIDRDVCVSIGGIGLRLIRTVQINEGNVHVSASSIDGRAVIISYGLEESPIRPIVQFLGIPSST